jgi:hypothetical protein
MTSRVAAWAFMVMAAGLLFRFSQTEQPNAVMGNKCLLKSTLNGVPFVIVLLP